MSSLPATNRRTLGAALLLLVLFVVQAASSLLQKSLTTDEGMYITAGYYHLEKGTFRYNMTNPPLVKVLAAIPLLALGPELPAAEGDPATWNEVEQWRYARRFLYENRVDARRMIAWARMPTVLIAALIGVLVCAWSRRLYGERAALLSLFLFAFCPNLLAHGRLATQDAALAATMLLAAFQLWRYVTRPSSGRLAVCGLAFGAAALTKTTAVFLVPIALLYSALLVARGDGTGTWTRLPLVRRIPESRPRARQALSLGMALLLVGVIVVGVLNVGYLFEGSFRPLSAAFDPERVREKLGGGVLADLALRFPVPLPGPLLELVRFQLAKVSGGHATYFHGQVSTSGWWYLMPASLLIKTPLALLVLVGAALVRIATSKAVSNAELLILTASASLVVLFSALKSVSVGLRYLLPLFPLLHVLVGRVLADGFPAQAWVRAALALLVAWYGVGTLRIHPHYLAHFNELVGGPSNGYRWLADSNLDWGQDLVGLRRYMDEQGIERIRLGYFGSGDAALYGIDYDYLPSVGLPPPAGEPWWFEPKARELAPLELSGGPMAVSASLVAGLFLRDHYAALRSREPAAQVGHSILIYEFD